MLRLKYHMHLLLLFITTLVMPLNGAQARTTYALEIEKAEDGSIDACSIRFNTINNKGFGLSGKITSSVNNPIELRDLQAAELTKEGVKAIEVRNLYLKTTAKKKTRVVKRGIYQKNGIPSRSKKWNHTAVPKFLSTPSVLLLKNPNTRFVLSKNNAIGRKFLNKCWRPYSRFIEKQYKAQHGDVVCLKNPKSCLAP